MTACRIIKAKSLPEDFPNDSKGQFVKTHNRPRSSRHSNGAMVSVLTKTCSGDIKKENMQTVSVKKAELLAIVQTNRDQHRAAFEKAFAGYQKECMEVLQNNLDALLKDSKHIVVFFEQPPADHTDDYDRVIAMLKMSVDENIELTNLDFAKYVQDDWDWKDSNSKYSTK